MIAAARRAARRARFALGTGRCTDQPVRFALREQRGPAVARAYRLRGSGLRACVRHRSGDAGVLREVFLRGDYEPPPEAAAALAAAGRPPRVVDLGGNIGLFALFAFGRFPGMEAVSFEPDPANAATLRRAIALNGLGDRWRLVEAAAATADGALEFDAGHGPLSQAAPGGGPGTIRVAARDVFAELGGVDLLKIDVEGGEWAILADPRFPNVPARALTMEYHAAFCPSADPGGLAASLLEGAGYRVRVVHEWDRDGADPRRTLRSAAGRLWAWRDAGAG